MATYGCRNLVLLLVMITGFGLLSDEASAQAVSREEAIARVARLYPNSEKPPEQIYDEGQIENVARAFAKRFRNRSLDALTGPLEEDFVRVVSVPATPPPVRTSTRSDSLQSVSTAGPASADTTDQVFPGPEQIRRVQRRSVFNTGHRVITTAEGDYSAVERRALRKDFLSLYEGLPSDVRLVVIPGAIHYRGQTATVEAKWEYDIVGHPTRLSRPYADLLGGDVTLQMRRVGDQWLVTDFRGFVEELKTRVASR